MILGYNTNGFAHHRLEDAIHVLAEIGYRAVGITIDHHALDPQSPDALRACARMAALLNRLEFRSVVETGGRFLLNSFEKHEPTLLSAESEGRRKRIAFYRHAIECAAALGSDCVSIWSGTLREPLPPPAAMARLVAGLREVLDIASAHGVTIAFEPEPGMFIDTLASFSALDTALGDRRLMLTVDVGHLHCQGEVPIGERIAEWAPRLRNVHLDDAMRGRHEHLMLGEGEIDFSPVLRSLQAAGYSGGVYLELSRHSHEAPLAARRAFAYLQRLLG